MSVFREVKSVTGTHGGVRHKTPTIFMGFNPKMSAVGWFSNFRRAYLNIYSKFYLSFLD